MMEKSKASFIKKMFCGCKSEFQDRTYGEHQRLHIVLYNKGHLTGYRCTVCGVDKGE